MPDDRPHRNERIAELLRREVGRFINEMVPTPEGTLVTVSRVVPSANHQHADVFVTIFPFERAEVVFEELEKHVAEVQHRINKELKMRPVPKIQFVLDESEERARNILDILDKTKEEPYGADEETN